MRWTEIVSRMMSGGSLDSTDNKEYKMHRESKYVLINYFYLNLINKIVAYTLHLVSD